MSPVGKLMIGAIGAVVLAASVYALAKRKPGRKWPGLQPKTSKIYVVGDSLGVGIGAQLSTIALLGQGSTGPSGAQVAGNPIESTRIDQWNSLAAMGPALSSYANVVVVSLGTNDAAMDPTAIEQRVGSGAANIVAMFEGRANVVWVLPPLTSALPHVGRVRDLITAAIGSSPNVDIVDVGDLPQRSGQVASDQIHPTPSMYSTIANMIWNDLFVGPVDD